MNDPHQDSLTNDPSDSHLDDGVPNDPRTGHVYDGIEEFDNPMPTWWKTIFVLTILYAVPYTMYYYGGAPGRTLADTYDAELSQVMQLQFAEIGELTPNRENVIRFLNQPNMLAIGRSVFKQNCTQCHGGDGGGLVGPNLCDDSYKNIRDIGDFIRVLQNGAAAGAMPAWKNRLSDNEIVLVSSYAASLRGSSPAKPKAAEGNKLDPWPTPPEPEEQEDPTKMSNSEASS